MKLGQVIDKKLEEIEAEEMKRLSFLDGVLLTSRIYENVLCKHLVDENGELVQGKEKGY